MGLKEGRNDERKENREWKKGRKMIGNGTAELVE
jgi:hypothetical protein